MSSDSTKSPQPKLPEVWRAIPGLDGYEASDQGRVRSFRVPNRKPHCPLRLRVLKGHRRKASGYRFVGVVKADGTTRHVGIHRLVLEAFVGFCPEGMQCRHLNGIRRDNRLENLCWGTPKENSADRIRHGNHVCGEAHPFAKLTVALVEKMRLWRGQGATYAAIAKEVGVTEGTARRACGHGWKHIH